MGDEEIDAMLDKKLTLRLQHFEHLQGAPASSESAYVARIR